MTKKQYSRNMMQDRWAEKEIKAGSLGKWIGNRCRKANNFANFRCQPNTVQEDTSEQENALGKREYKWKYDGALFILLFILLSHCLTAYDSRKSSLFP